jgi:hypothetical protein
LKKTDRFGFVFLSLEPEKLNQTEKPEKKPSQTEKPSQTGKKPRQNQAKLENPSQTGLNRFLL